ncbi:hypothetical protein AHAS_Ahas17G0040700 [Arachis hypogaea]
MASLMKHDKCNRYISGGYCRGFLLGICLRSCDGPELKMDKSVATAESLFLQDRIDSNPDLHEVEKYSFQFERGCRLSLHSELVGVDNKCIGKFCANEASPHGGVVNNPFQFSPIMAPFFLYH